MAVMTRASPFEVLEFTWSLVLHLMCHMITAYKNLPVHLM